MKVRNLTISQGSQIDLSDSTDIKESFQMYVQDTEERFRAIINWIESQTAPEYTTAERDAITPKNGQIIYNSSNNRFEIRQNGAWKYITNVSSA